MLWCFPETVGSNPVLKPSIVTLNFISTYTEGLFYQIELPIFYRGWVSTSLISLIMFNDVEANNNCCILFVAPKIAQRQLMIETFCLWSFLPSQF